MTLASRMPPRWRVVFDELRAELDSRAYGSPFYSIAEVCQKFHVSQITAIRALNELASRNLIEKIWGKGHVVRLRRQPAFIRMVIPEVATQNFNLDVALRRRLEGISAAAKALDLDFDTLSENHLKRLFPRQGEAFGFLIPHSVDPTTLTFLREHQLPMIFVDPLDHYRNLRHARCDRVRAGYLATRHLLDLGHRRIGVITGLTSQRNFRDRLRGYRNALAEAGISFRWSLIRETPSLHSHLSKPALLELLKLTRPPTAIITGDDSRAIHVLEACKELGIAVPQQLSIVGYPNYPESRLTDPPLTVVDAHFERVGEAAVRLLLELMFDSRKPVRQQVLVEPTLVVRGSTAPPPRPSGADPVPPSSPLSPR